MYRQLQRPTKITKSRGNVNPSKEYSNWPKDREVQELPNREFKIIIKRMLRELLENTDKQCNKSRKTIQEQNKFNEEIGNIKKNQTESLHLKNTLIEWKN